MKRDYLERELKKVGVTINGWMPVLACDVCKHRWAPFSTTVSSSAPTIRFDYWQCKNRCNAGSRVSREIQTATPKYVTINDGPGMIFGDDDLREFEEYVRSMDATVITNRNL